MRTYNPDYLARLEEQAESARAAFIAARDAQDLARLDLQRAEGPYDTPAVREKLASQSDAVDVARRKVERATAAVERLAPRATATKSVFRACSTYIAENQIRPSAKNLEAAYPSPQLSPDKVQKAVEKVRGDILALKSQRLDTERLHVSKEVAQARIEAEFAAVEKQFGPDESTWLFQPDGGAYGAVMRTIDGGVIRGVPVPIHEINPRILLPLIMKDARAVYGLKISAFYNEAGPGISDGDRRARIAQIEGQIDQLEQREEALIRLADDNSIVIDRRVDASPAAMIGPMFEEEMDEGEYVPRGQPAQFVKSRMTAAPAQHRGPLTQAAEDTNWMNK